MIIGIVWNVWLFTTIIFGYRTDNFRPGCHFLRYQHRPAPIVWFLNRTGQPKTVLCMGYGSPQEWWDAQRRLQDIGE